MKNEKDIPIAKSFRIEPVTPIKFGDNIYNYIENYICVVADSWDNFCIDSLYKEWKKLGVTKAFIINREEFRKFILWALPRYENRFNKENTNGK